MITDDFILHFLGRRRDDSATRRRGHSRVSIDIPTHYRLVCGRTRVSASHSCTSLSISPSVQGSTTEKHAVSAVLGPLSWGIYTQTLPFPRGKDLAVPTILLPSAYARVMAHGQSPSRDSLSLAPGGADVTRKRQRTGPEGRAAYPRRRAAQACLTCRRKRIKCDNERPSCTSCSRLATECVYQESDKSRYHHAPETLRGTARLSAHACALTASTLPAWQY
jgi:hypothetical protein